jgi:hypothetical protein
LLPIRRTLRRKPILLKLYKLLLMFTITIRRRFEGQSTAIMIDVGAGLTYKKNWKTLDYPSDFYNTVWTIDYVFDLMGFGKLPVCDRSVKLFYCEHVLEHITDKAVQHLFGEVYRCLVRNGAVRVSVPNIERAYEAYAKGNLEFFRDMYFSLNRDFLREETSLEKLFLHHFAGYVADSVDPKEVHHDFDRMSMVDFLNSYSTAAQDIIAKTPAIQKALSHYHVNWFNFDKLARMLRTAGFDVIYRSAPQGSRFPEMVGSGFDRRPDSLIVEAIRTHE